MSNTRQVDERVLSMQFDNKQFEKNVATSLSTVEKLKKSLNLTESAKNLDNLSKAANRFDMSGISRGVEAVQAKFSAFQVMAVTALANITNQAVNYGKRIASALTIEPIKMGFQEYETQINAVQTILANTQSKGTTLDNVNSALDELNTYADKTIYNFTEMTRNIGTFTAAGVDLDTSVQAIKGIANLAAVSGSTSQQASTAMYQLSQALASGTVKLMDWNSVVNAGMGGQVFQDALKETARVHGINIDGMIAKEGSFRETLKDGWLTSSILTETLSKFTGDLNAEQLKSMGYTDEQIKEILKLGQTANDAATKVKTFTQLMDTLKEAAQSGWTQTWEILIGDFEEAKKLWTSVSDTIGGMLNASAESRNTMLQGWSDAGGREQVIKSISNIFKGLLDIIKPVSEAFREIFPPTTSQQLLGITQGLLKLTEKFKISEKTADNLKRTFKGVFALFDIGGKVIKALFSGFAKLVGYIAPAGNGVLGFTASIGDFIVKINEALESTDAFNKVINTIGKFLKPVADGIKILGKSISDSVGAVFNKAGERLSPLAALGAAIKAIFVGIGKVLEKVAPVFTAIATKIGEAFKAIQQAISSAIMDSDYNKLFDLFNGGLLAAIGVGIYKFIKNLSKTTESAGGFLDSIKDILSGVSDSLNAFTQSIKAKTLKTIATAIAILAGALLVIALIPSDKLTNSLAAITTLFVELIATLSIFGKISEGKGFNSLGKISRALVTISVALLILAGAMKIMSTMSGAGLAKSIIGITAGLGVLVAAVKLLPEKDLHQSVKAIKKMAGALVVLSVAMKIIATMSGKELAKSIIGITAGLGVMVAAIRLLPKDVKVKTSGMIAMAAALVVLGVAMKNIGSLSVEQIAKGLVGIAVGLGVMVAAIRLLPKNMMLQSVSMVILSTSLLILGKAIKNMASMSWLEMGKGLAVLAGSLLILAAAMALMKNGLAGAGAMLVMSAALTIFLPVLKSLSKMSWKEIATGLLTLAGVFVVVGVAGYALAPVVPAILGLAGAIALLGIACTAVGIGVMAFATGLTMLAAAGAGAAVAITAIISSLLGLIPYAAQQVGLGIIEICKAIAGGSEAICEAVTVIVLAVVKAIVTCVPAIVDGIFVLIDKLLESLVTYVPKIVGALYDLLIGIINKIAEKLPDLIKAGVNLLMAFFQGVIDALKTVDPNVLVNGILAVGMLTALVASLAAIAALTPAAMVGVLGLGAVITELGIVLAAIGALAQIPGLSSLIEDGGDFLETVGTAIGQFIGGIVGGIGQGLTASLPDMGKNLSSFMKNATPFFEGAKKIDSSALKGMITIAEMIIILTGASFLESISSFLTGSSSLDKFGNELVSFGKSMTKYAETVKGIDAEAITASANAAKCLSELASNLPNSGGMAAWFAGENDIDDFGDKLAPFGRGMKKYSDSIKGINSEAVAASANAAKALVEMTSHIPNTGGMVAWFTGENSIVNFGSDIVRLGKSLAKYSKEVKSINAKAVTASAKAAKALAEMTSHIPNSGGMVAWFTGDNSIAQFGDELRDLGRGLRKFSEETKDIKPENIKAAASAAKSIVDMASRIPNTGGMVAWFTGDNSIAQFGDELRDLGRGLRKFSEETKDIIPESIKAAASAAKSLAQMADHIPNEGGMVAWFTGDNSIAMFGDELNDLGRGLRKFSEETKGIKPENVKAAASAAKSLAQMANIVPNSGGVASWFAGDNSIAEFGDELKDLGKGLRKFSEETKGIVPENIKAAADAAKKLVEMTNAVPNVGGMQEWVNGISGVPDFIDNLPDLGEGLQDFSDSVENIKTDKVGVAADAAKKLAEMTKTVPNVDGMKAWFDGKSGMPQFIDNLKPLGEGLTKFADSVKDIKNIDGVKKAVDICKKIAELPSLLPDEDGLEQAIHGQKNISNYVSLLKKLGKGIAQADTEIKDVNVDRLVTILDSVQKVFKTLLDINTFIVQDTLNSITRGLSAISETMEDTIDVSDGFSDEQITRAVEMITSIAEATKTVNPLSLAAVSGAIKTLTKAASTYSELNYKEIEKVTKAIYGLCLIDIDAFSKSLSEINSYMNKTGTGMVNSLNKGLNDRTARAKIIATISSLCSSATKTVKSVVPSFKESGKNSVMGFANGLSSNTYLAIAKAREMANAAANAAKKALDEHSPSKVFYKIGDFGGIAFVNALRDNVFKAGKAGKELAGSSIDGLKHTISRIAEAVDGDMDFQPTIRPVLDLSDVRAGAGAISGMLNGGSLAYNTGLAGSISASMGGNRNGNNDVISAIKELGRKFSSSPGNIYNVNGVTYDDGTNVSNAVEDLVRAIKIDGRS